MFLEYNKNAKSIEEIKIHMKKYGYVYNEINTKIYGDDNNIVFSREDVLLEKEEPSKNFDVVVNVWDNSYHLLGYIPNSNNALYSPKYYDVFQDVTLECMCMGFEIELKQFC